MFWLVRGRIVKKCENFKIKSCLKNAVPVIDWLPNYHWKKDILGDVAAGITVAVMHIPQGEFSIIKISLDLFRYISILTHSN